MKPGLFRSSVRAITLACLLTGFGVCVVSTPVQAQAQAANGGQRFREQLKSSYDIMAATPMVYSENEVDDYGEKALHLKGDERLYALWRVLYAYKNDQNEAGLVKWRNRISAEAQKDSDTNLDLLARFMYQAYENESHDFTAFTDRDWQGYLSTPSKALRYMLMVERVRQFQHYRQWADANDLGNAVIISLQDEGKPAEGLLSVAHQVMSYSLNEIGDNDNYAAHMLAFTKLSRDNAFFSQKMDAIYDLAQWATREDDMPVAEQFQSLHAANVRKYNIEDLKTWDEYLCAYVEDQARKYQAVVNCLKDADIIHGQVTNSLDVWKLRLLTNAYAHIHDAQHGRYFLNKLQAVPETINPRDRFYETALEANLLQSEGKSFDAFQMLDNWSRDMDRQNEVIRESSVQGMYKALRKELDRKTAESRLLSQKVQMGHMLLGAAAVIALLLAVILVGGALWVIRMRRMQWHLRDAHDLAEAANAAKTRFLAVMSHELRTPLNGVLGMAQALKKDDLNETQKEQVDILVDSGQTLMILLNDVLDMSRIEAGKIELAPVHTSLKDMMERVVNTYAPLIAEKDISLTYELADGANVPMSFDILRVYQCLSNLVSNALKFTERGSVRIYAAVEALAAGGYMVSVEIRDTGIGMNRTTVDKLFEAYTQADAMTTRKYGGSGLGLNISRRLAELMGGGIRVTSEEGVGSCFVITFTAGAVDMADQVSELTRLVSEPEENADMPGMKILLVDDHPVNRKVARLFLEPFGFIITEAADGQEALDLDMSRYDLVLMDLNMPRLGGLEASRIFRSHEAPGKHVPIVALTADAMQDQVAACMAAGMDAHISKPILMDTLIDTVTRLLRIQPDDEVAAE